MAGSCYYHPESASAGSCIQCGMPACSNCLEQVGEKFVCRKCSPAFKARLAQQAAAAPPFPASAAPPYASAAVVGQTSDAKEMFLGIGLATVIGIIGAIIIEKILFNFGFGLSLLYIGLGYGIGWGIHRVTGRGGSGLAMAAVAIMVLCLGVSHLVYASDLLNQARSAGNADASVTVMDAFPLVISKLGMMHWVCITFGLLACYRGVEAQQG